MTLGSAEPVSATLPVPPQPLLRQLRDAHGSHIPRIARADPCVFAEYVMRDEETGQPIRLNPMHREWHALANNHKRLQIWAHVEAGKTQMISIARSLWELGRNPSLRIAITSNTDGQAQRICTTIARYIERSEELHRVFPELKRSKRMPWTAHTIFVERPTLAKDPSVRTCGIHSSVLGARIDFLVLDDLLDYENTRTQSGRDDLYAWYQSTLEGRLTQNSRVISVGTAWHRDDIMHRFARRADWVSMRYPVVTEQSGITWSLRWSEERIKAKRIALGPLEFSRQCLCVARSDEDARFKLEWIQNCLLRGEGRSLTYALQTIPSGYSTYTGVDLGVRQNSNSDLTSMFTIVVHPDGTREVLDITAGRWAGPEIVERIVDLHYRYGSIVIVENNAAQEFIIQFTKNVSAVPVRAFTTTGKAAHHPEFGIESLATEMANGKWIIPSRMGEGGVLVASHPELESWVNELIYYDPRSHPGDRLMSSWFAREGSRTTRAVVRTGHIDTMTR